MNIFVGLILGIFYGIIQYLVWKKFLSKPSFSTNTLKVTVMGFLSIFVIFIFLLLVTLLKKDLLIWTAAGVFITILITSVYTYIRDRRREG